MSQDTLAYPDWCAYSDDQKITDREAGDEDICNVVSREMNEDGDEHEGIACRK